MDRCMNSITIAVRYSMNMVCACRLPACQLLSIQDIAQLALAIGLPRRVLSLLEMQVVQVQAVHLVS